MPREDPAQARWFAEHLQPHEAMLRAWLQSRFPVGFDLDDLLQEARVRVLRARSEGREMTSPKAFFFATARNLALDHLRHQKVARTESLVESDALSVLDEGTGIPEAIAHNQDLEILTAAIQSLPDRCRQIFTLRKVYGMSQKEIGHQLGISEHTVSAQLTIGLQKCSDFMAVYRDGKRGCLRELFIFRRRQAD